MTSMVRYGLRFTDHWLRIPTVEATLPTWGKVVRRFHGVTNAHAYRRALAWTRKNGDPR